MALDDPSIVERISGASKKFINVMSQWWNLTTADKRTPPNPARLVTVRQLPIYTEDEKKPSYKFVMDEALPFQREISTLRRACAAEYQRIAVRCCFIIICHTNISNQARGKAMTDFGRIFQCATFQLKYDLIETKSYVETEWTVLPKAAAITVGGMAGFVLGLRRGFIGRAVYTTVGMVTMGAFCYPYETVDVVREGIDYSERAWKQFKDSPQPREKSGDKENARV